MDKELIWDLNLKRKRDVFIFSPSESKVKYEMLNRKLKRKERRCMRKLITNVHGHLCQNKRTFYKVPWLPFPNVILPCPESLARAIPQKDYFSYLPSAHLDRCLEEFLFPLSSPCLLAPTGRSDWVYQHDTLFAEKSRVIGGLCKWQATAWNWSQEFWRRASVALGAMK